MSSLELLSYQSYYGFSRWPNRTVWRQHRKSMPKQDTVLETEAGLYAREVGGVDERPILESWRMVSRTFKV